MDFFNSAIDVLHTLVIGQDNPAAKSQGGKQLGAGGGVALSGVTLIPLLSGLLG